MTLQTDQRRHEHGQRSESVRVQAANGRHQIYRADRRLVALASHKIGKVSAVDAVIGPRVGR
jgi:hypothetical protein